MEEFLRIGKIIKPRGIKGEVKVMPYSDGEKFSRLKGAFIDGVFFAVEKVNVSDGIYLKFKGVNDRNAAELLRGKELSVRREDAEPLENGEYYVVDLIGLPVFTESKKIGVLIDVTSAKTDIFTVKCDDGNVLRFPFLKDLVLSIDVVGGKITLKQKRLDEVGVYEI